MKSLWLCATVALFASSTPAAAGRIILSGDSTPAFALGLSGNDRFYRNVLGSGSHVAVSDNSYSISVDDVAYFYRYNVGAEVDRLGSPLTAGALAGVDLLYMTFPRTAVAATEVAAIGAFLANGGTLFLTGEARDAVYAPPPTIPPAPPHPLEPIGHLSIAIVNDMLTALGSTMSLMLDAVDIGNQDALGSEIVNHPLTTGVTSYRYGFTSTVVGGSALFLTDGGAAFTAVEEIAAVGEPASLAIMGVGVAALGLRRRRRAHSR